MKNMGGPSINIIFAQAAKTIASLSAKGTVAVIVRDNTSTGGHTIYRPSQIPELSVSNREYVARTFTGGEGKPKKVYLYVLDASDLEGGEKLDKALEWLSGCVFDWMCAPPDVTAEECGQIVTWVAAQREQHKITKAVLPNTEADDYTIVNFAGSGLREGQDSYTSGQFCSRIVGLIAGTPYARSITYAPFPELSDCDRLSQAEEDAAVDAGKLVTIYDGAKVKLSRGVNSLTTVGKDITDAYKKIKFIEVYDRIDFELRQLIADNYIGRYTNNYDNECILVTAVHSFFEALAAEGLIQDDWSVSYDVESKRSYLLELGVDESKMTDDEVKHYSTDSHVFIAVRCKILDAIEDVTIAVTLY